MKFVKIFWNVSVLFGCFSCIESSSYVINTFRNPNVTEGFSHLVKNTETGSIYIAGLNKIYEVTSDLVKEQEVATGPVKDNPMCLPNQMHTCQDVKSMPIYNKALVIDYRNKRLIACSSLFHGICEKRHLADITQKDPIEYIPVVANNETATTVAFIAPGPGPVDQLPKPNVLYVGAQRTNTGLIAARDLAPAFSSRDLNTFSIFKKGITTSTSKETEAQQKQSFPIYYKFGFSSEGFSYVATVQKASATSEKYISKLIRVCQGDEDYYSYTEIELKCTYNGNEYPLVQAINFGKPAIGLAQSLGIPTTEDFLFGVFSLGRPNSVEALNNSALCLFPMRDVRQIFTRNIRRCFEGVGNTGPDHIVNPVPCVYSEFKDQIDDNYCGVHDFNTPINGGIPIQATAALTLNVSVTAITVSTTYKYTVAFLGTNTGHIIKVALESQHVAKAYEDIPIEPNSPILSNMAFDSENEHLYVMTKSAVYKVIVQDCSQYTSCATCRGAKDPYCGWCSLEDKCSLREDCLDHESELRWLEYSGQTCTNITQVYPDKIQKDKAVKTTTLTLNISNLPSYSGQYKCAFDGYKVHEETPANRTGPNVITCETPLPNKLPPFPTGADHIVMKLSVLMNQKDFVSTNFTFFDCDVHTKESCYRCTLSRFNCTWCVNDHRCTHYPRGECSGDDTFISGQNSQGLQLAHSIGPQFCPSIESSSKEWILIPSGTSKEIPLTGHNLLPFQTPLYCFFSLNNGVTVRAQRIKHTSSVDLIECQSVQFSYAQDINFKNVPFKIVWGSETSNKFLDNPGNIQVKMFKCEMMASTCGECLTLNPGYGCGWCGKKCSIQKKCQNHDWLPHSVTCPNPQIESISPLLGPKKGGTLLTIRGKNLGKKFEDIVSNVDVVGITCTPIREFYKPASVIVCRTGELIGGGGTKGLVRVTVESKYVAASSQTFSYVDPQITDISPRRGPQSGGTSVTITGKYINAGTTLSVMIGSYPCKVERSTITPTSVVCMTVPSKNISQETMDLVFDNQDVPSNIQYEYTVDPYITDVIPKRAIFSGGIKITVIGQYLDSIQEPRMIIWKGNEPREGECESHGCKKLICYSPQIKYRMPYNNVGIGIPFQYGFKMDGVKELMNLSKVSPSEFKNFTLYPDPEFKKFTNQMKSHTRKNDKILIISGKYIGKGFEESDVRVRVGREFCNVTAAVKQLTCYLPEKQPGSVSGTKYPEVEIDVGINFTVFLGYLKYEESDLPIPLTYIILIAVGGGILIICIVTIIIMYYFKSKKNDSLMKDLQIQMDNLEAKVAKECKEAFAELQTDITELNNDLYGQVAIPFWDYRTYCMRVLFPQELDTDHPVIRDLDVDYSKRDTVEKGLKLFAQLVNNKTFLLIFVRTLEGHKQFTMRDRVNVASLLSVALQTKMEYATDILKTLLAELIEKSVEGKNHPKLLLRRTESVAEKMLTNWFTFLLYKFLRECAGEPLFMLYTAVKQQVSKGPVDAVTGEARYSLSEDKLIRQQMEYRQMTIFVQDMEQYGQQPHPVKVLDCDTVSQVKEKILDAIYKNAPFSSRPARDDVDLVLFDQSTTEWNSGFKGRLILHDDDNTSKQEGDYRRNNTLAHYKVPDSAYMTLVPKQPPSIYNLSISSSEKSSGSKLYENLSYTRSPSLNRTLSPQQVHVEVENGGIKHYHLVKQHDSETHKEGDRGSKMVSEIYLTRLLATKGTLQQFVDDMFERIFSTAHRGTVLPLAIKYMFDFLDDQALLHNIQDSEVVHTWKSNSLPLRFWVNVIKNPNFVFDIYKSNIVDSCLSVVAQTFMDSCSMSEHRLSKDSPSSKLLYAKDIPKYKKWVERYYQDIKMMPAISDQDMTAMMTEESRAHGDEFNVNAALLELYKYVQRYNDELWTALEEDEFARKNKLTYKLEQVRMAMEKEVYI